MSKLQPVQRADKNGKIVTRHVKVDESRGRTAKIAAAPSLNARPTVQQMRNKLAVALDVPKDELSEEIKDPARLESLLKLAESHNLTDAFEDTVERLYLIEGEDFYRCIEFMERNFDYTGEVLGSKRLDAPRLVTSLNLYDFPITHEEERVLIRAACLLWREDKMLQNPIRMFALFPRPQQSVRIGSKSIGSCALNNELAKYFLSNPESVDSIVNVIVERKLNSPSEIDAIVRNSASPTLMSGAL